MTGKTIVYLPNWIGDMVMATPFLRSLRASLDGELWAIGKPSALGIYNGLELFNRFIPIENKGITHFFDTVKHIKGLKFERSISLPHSMRSALLFFLAGIRQRIGYPRNKRGFMLTLCVKETIRPEPTVEHYLKILDALGEKRLYRDPVLIVTHDEEKRYSEDHEYRQKPYIAFIPGAQYGPSKRWPPSYFAELADLIYENMGYSVVILPGKDEIEVGLDIKNRATYKDNMDIEDLGIPDLKVCISRAAAVVSNDTGPRHISTALSVPTFVLIGPMDEEYTDYPSPNTIRFIKDVPCRPCNKKTCKRNMECLYGITPFEVYKKMEEIIGGKGHIESSKKER
ncbi:MAG: lipopolysaccharide heptosyltransferase II [Syntrophorhabdaceae bacterium]|nr:lipopolysaccharide heptosyltransferase II [Syntrophorhabdaceae bacterium]